MPAVKLIASRSSGMLQLVEQQRAALAQAKTDAIVARASVSPIGEVGGWALHLVDFGAANQAAARTSVVTIDASGFGVQVLQGGSDRMAAAIDAGAGGFYGPAYPGWAVRTKRRFTRLRVRPWETNTLPLAGPSFTAVGTYQSGRFLTIAVAQTPDADFLEPGAVGAGFQYYRYLPQIYNVTTNVPTGDTDGVSIRGATAVAVEVSGTTQTGLITAGTVVWWKTFSTGARWGETDVQQPLVVNGRAFCNLSELEVHASDGRLFPEVRGYTDSNGSASPVNVKCYVFGTGGELNLSGMNT